MWFAILTLWSVHAEILPVVEVIYQPPPQAASCQMLKHRELEREKVIREQGELTGFKATQVNQLLTNKLFMPGDTWRDETVNVRVSIVMSERMQREMERVGLDRLYLRIRAPGLVWESYAFQTPAGLDVVWDSDNRLILNYMTYQNVLCLENLFSPQIEWVAAED